MPDQTIDDILPDHLTPAQCAVVQDESDRILCLACAGSGKSRTLAYRIARLLASGADPGGIVAFTFTEKAAESIKLRVAQALQAAGQSPLLLGAMYIGTIHGFCQSLLGEIDAKYRQYDVLDANRLKLYLISRYPALRINEVRDSRGGSRPGYFATIAKVADAWTTLNDEMLSIDDVLEHDPELGALLERVRVGLQHDQFIDFSMMIRHVVDALVANHPGVGSVTDRVQHLMVDEYQDVNPLQERLIARLADHLESLMVVGDDDQAIYAWRGADVSNILEFEERYDGVSVHRLSVNFRSTEPIVSTSDAFAAAELGPSRFTKDPTANRTASPREFRTSWFSDRPAEATWVGDRIQSMLGQRYLDDPDNPESARGLTFADFGILMRSTAMPEQNGEPRHAAFSRELAARGIPFSLESGGSIFDLPHVAAMRAAFELLRNGAPNREQVKEFYDTTVSPLFPNANFRDVTAAITAWSRRIHPPQDGPRVRLYPQQLVHDLLSAFGIASTPLDEGTMQALGTFSRILQDVESVYMSVDSQRRFQEVLNFLNNAAEAGYEQATSDVLRRPNTVTVSTVHKVKGLEFPVVFVVDVEAQRFPKSRRGYEGWLPTACLERAIGRGAYQSTRDEEARLFYTAITRAERFLFISGAEQLPDARRPKRQSAFIGRLSHPELVTQLDQASPMGEQSEPRRRIDETVMPTSYSDIKYYLKCPRDYQLRKCFGFSPPISDLFGFGATVHAAVCKLHEVAGDRPPEANVGRAIAEDVFHLKHVPMSKDPENNPGPYERAREAAASIVEEYAELYAADFERRRQVEVQFEIPVTNAVISGAIDLMLREAEDGTIIEAEVIDFKAMEGGSEPEENGDLHWTEMALQVQLYARAARDVLGENAQTGAVHLLKDNQRIEVPVGEDAVAAALSNVEWAVERIIDGDFPMRPEGTKCAACDFSSICAQSPQEFRINGQPRDLHVPGAGGQVAARCWSQYDESHGTTR